MLFIFLLSFFFNFLFTLTRGQISDCSLEASPTSNTVSACPESNNIYKGKQTKTPTVTTVYNCEYCDTYDLFLAGFGGMGADQTPSDELRFGSQGPTPQAARVPTASKIIFKGLTSQFYTADCGVPNNGNLAICDSSTSYTGVPRCLCTSAPSVQTNTRISNDQNLGYYYDTSTATDRFFPQVPGHYMFFFDCMGTGATSDAAILILNSAGTVLLHSRKSAVGGYIGLNLSIVVTFNTVGGVNDWVFVYCANCEAGNFNYCGYTVFRVG